MTDETPGDVPGDGSDTDGWTAAMQGRLRGLVEELREQPALTDAKLVSRDADCGPILAAAREQPTGRYTARGGLGRSNPRRDQPDGDDGQEISEFTPPPCREESRSQCDEQALNSTCERENP